MNRSFQVTNCALKVFMHSYTLVKSHVSVLTISGYAVKDKKYLFLFSTPDTEYSSRDPDDSSCRERQCRELRNCNFIFPASNGKDTILTPTKDRPAGRLHRVSGDYLRRYHYRSDPERIKVHRIIHLLEKNLVLNG